MNNISKILKCIDMKRLKQIIKTIMSQFKALIKEVPIYQR